MKIPPPPAKCGAIIYQILHSFVATETKTVTAISARGTLSQSGWGSGGKSENMQSMNSEVILRQGVRKNSTSLFTKLSVGMFQGFC